MLTTPQMSCGWARPTNMNTVKEVLFGTKQEAIITPKAGHEIETVIVTNTVDGSVVPVEIKQISDSPAQWSCVFAQPAGHVSIKPVLKPIVYSITFEVSDECNIVLVEQDSPADIEIKSVIHQESEADDPAPAESIAQSEENTTPDFKQPQHSLDHQKSEGLSVGASPVSDTINVSTSADDAPDVDDDTSQTEPVPHGDADDFTEPVGDDVVNDSAAQSHDVEYEAAEPFADELEDVEPVVISSAEYEKKNEIFWQWKNEYDAGRCPKKKFMAIKERHMQFMDDVTNGKIVVK